MRPSTGLMSRTLKSAALGSPLRTKGSCFAPRQPPYWPGVMYRVLSQWGAGVITYGGSEPL